MIAPPCDRSGQNLENKYCKNVTQQAERQTARRIVSTYTSPGSYGGRVATCLVSTRVGVEVLKVGITLSTCQAPFSLTP